jgi:UMF1 family MFS transporter
MSESSTSRPATWLARLGLDRPELRAWALYDWANSVFMTTILQVFPIFFRTVAAVDLPTAVASARFALSTSIGVGVVAVMSPLLGAAADYAGNKKKMLGVFLGVGVLATAAMVLVDRGEWLLGAVLFAVGNIGATATLAFYNSLLPHIASREEVDRVSSAGYALGYLGGGLLLAVNLLWIAKPELFGIPDPPAAMRLSFLSASVWWAGFSIPLFLRVPEPPRRLETDERPQGNAIAVAVSRIAETVREMRAHRDGGLMLLAYFVYNDGINTIIRMATLYGTEIGISSGALIGAILLVQFVGVPFAFLFGSLAGRIGPKPAIFGTLGVYTLITLIGYYMTTATHFFILALLVGTVQGGAQALSRSLFSTLIPRHKSAEMFGFFGIFDKFGGVMGSALFAAVITATGSSRPAILALAVFFVIGGALLALVDVERGRRLALEAEARLTEPATTGAP